MRFVLAILISLRLMTAPVAVLACEGDCIVGITNAFLGNYTTPVHNLLYTIAGQISNMLPDPPGADAAMRFLKPLADDYRSSSYKGMETAIFPSYFHGKCNRDSPDGTNPPGCPNPDCPVVCGTPGSLVHFYNKLRFITYNQTRHLLGTLSKPSSPTYERIEHAVMDAANAKTKRMLRVYSRASPYGTTPFLLTKRATDTKEKLRQIMSNIEPLLLDICGGSDGETDGLSNCSWEDEMKEYILTFP